jgi:hypothetical protein
MQGKAGRMMTTEEKKSCFGCVHRASRMRGTTPRSWCKKYHTVPAQRCIDYCYKPKAVSLALRFVKAMGAGLK